MSIYSVPTLKRSSEYEELVSSMQGAPAQKKVHSKVRYLILSSLKSLIALLSPSKIFFNHFS